MVRVVIYRGVSTDTHRRDAVNSVNTQHAGRGSWWVVGVLGNRRGRGGEALGGRSEGGILWWWPRGRQRENKGSSLETRVVHIAEDQVCWDPLNTERYMAEGGFKQCKRAFEIGNILCEIGPRLGVIGGHRLQRCQAHTRSKSPGEDMDAALLYCHRRVDGRLQRRLAWRCVDRLLAVRDDQHDLSRLLAATRIKELLRGLEAVGDRGLAVRRHLVDSRVDLGRAVRPPHARRRIRREGHHGEAHRVHAEGVVAHQLLGKSLQPVGPVHRAVRQGLLHRAAFVEH